MQKCASFSLIKVHGAKHTNLSTHRAWQLTFCIANKHPDYKFISSDSDSHPLSQVIFSPPQCPDSFVMDRAEEKGTFLKCDFGQMKDDTCERNMAKS